MYCTAVNQTYANSMLKDARPSSDFGRDRCNMGHVGQMGNDSLVKEAELYNNVKMFN